MLKPDIQCRLKKDFGDDFMEVIKEINQWDAETKGLLGDRLLRATIYLSRGRLKRFKEVKEMGRTDYRDVLWQAEYDGGEEHLRDFNRPFGNETN